MKPHAASGGQRRGEVFAGGDDLPLGIRRVIPFLEGGKNPKDDVFHSRICFWGFLASKNLVS